MNEDILILLLISPFMCAFLLGPTFDMLEYWGKEPSNKTEIVMGHPRSIWVWKNWRKWTWIEVVLSPVFTWAYLGIGLLFVFMFLVYIVLLNR